MPGRLRRGANWREQAALKQLAAAVSWEQIVGAVEETSTPIRSYCRSLKNWPGLVMDVVNGLLAP